MMIGLCMGAGIIEMVLVGADIGPRQPLRPDERFQRVLAHDPSGKPQPAYRHHAVVRILPIVRVDQRRIRGVGRCKPHRAARPGTQIGAVQRHPTVLHGGNACLDS